MLPDPRESLGISEAAARVGVSKRTVTRWIEKGARLKAGSQLKLRANRLPSGFRTTEAWLDEFIAELTSDRIGPRAGSAVDEERARRAAGVLAATGW
jgi:excisionase family DNA binding protein